MIEGLRRRVSGDVLVVGAWTILTVLVATLPVVRGSFLRPLIAGAFLLFVPGYALITALFVRAEQLTLLERAVFSVGASLAIVGLVGIPLGEIPLLGIHLWTLLPVLLASIIVLLAVAERRRAAVDPDDRADPLGELLSLVRSARTGRSTVGGGSRVVQVAIVLAMVVSVSATVYVVATPLPSEQYTEFYVVGPDGTVDGIPESIDADDELEVVVGVANNEHRTIEYGLQVQVRGEQDAVLTTDEWRIEHNETDEQLLALAPPTTGTVEIEFLLFYDEGPDDVVDPDQADRHLAIEVTVADD